jgi:hypothetical protein
MSRLARLIPLLLLVVAFLGWETYQAWIAPPAADLPAIGEGQQIVSAAGDNASEQLAAAELAAAVSAITSRPLLRPDRQPFKEVPIASAVAQRNYESELSRFSVIGILPIDGKEKALIVRKGGGPGNERWETGPGDTLPGFVVKAIRPEGVLLAADGQEFLLPLYAGGPRQGGAARTEVMPSHPVAGSAPAFPGTAVGQNATGGSQPGVVPFPQPLSVYPEGRSLPGITREPGNVRNRARILPPRPSQPPVANPE